MFPKTHRLNLRQEKDFFRVAKRKSFPVFQLFWLPTTEHAKFALVVPKKVSLKATARHKILRQMRSIVWNQRSLISHKKIVLVLFRQSLDLSHQQLEESTKKAFESIEPRVI